MVGTTSLVAPYADRRAVIEPAWSLVRGTRTFQPNSGLVSNHDSCSRRPTVEPTTASDGNSTAAEAISACDLAQGAGVGALVDRRAVLGDGHGGGRRAAGGQQVAQGAARLSGVPRTTTVTLSPVERAQSTLVSPPLTTCSIGDAAEVSGTPA